jgi:hypothetical protein
VKKQSDRPIISAAQFSHIRKTLGAFIPLQGFHDSVESNPSLILRAAPGRNSLEGRW